MSKILYLDQFIVSNLADKVDDNHINLLNILYQKVRDGKIVCPLSNEHYIESAYRKINDAKENDRILNDLSGNLCFLPLLDITLNLFVRVCKNQKIRKEDFLGKAIKNFLSIETKILEVRSRSIKAKENSKKSTKGINEIRKIINESRRNENITKSELYLYTKDIMFNKFIARFEEVIRNGYIVVRSERIGNEVIPSYIDQIIEYLLRNGNLEGNGAKRLFSALFTGKFKKISTLNCLSMLSAYQACMQKQISYNDQIDNDRIASSVEVSDFLVTDSQRKSEIKAIGLDEIYNCKIYSGKHKDIKKLIIDISNL